MCVCVCLCVCEWGIVLWTFTAWYLCAAVKWAHCTEKKGAISGPWHRRPPGKSKHKPESYWIVLSCRVAPAPAFLKSDPVWLKRGQMGHHNQLSPLGSVCLFAKTHGTYHHSLWSIQKKKQRWYPQESERKGRGIQMERDVQITTRCPTRRKSPAPQKTNLFSSLLSWSAIIMNTSRAITFQKWLTSWWPLQTRLPLYWSRINRATSYLIYLFSYTRAATE